MRQGAEACTDTPSVQQLAAASVFLDLFQHGGRPLEYIHEGGFLQKLGPGDVHRMFTLGTAHRPGFLLNSEELSGFVHLPHVPEDDFRLCALMDVLDGLQPPVTRFEEGMLIGYRRQGGQRIPIHLPESALQRHGHLLGASGMGKSYLMETMCLQDIQKGCGVAVIDPHGDLVQRILGLLPEDALDRTVYFNPGDPDYVPMWNILSAPGLDPSRLADEFTGAFRAISEGWGDRLAHILRNVLSGLITLDGATLLDVPVLLGRNNPKRANLMKRAAAVQRNLSARRFWEHDLKDYTKNDFQPVLHKVSKLLSHDGLARTLAQPENRFDFRQMLANRSIFLADLSAFGPETRNILGSFLLSLIYLAALERVNVPASEYYPHRVYADEAHRFIVGPMSEIIAETRKRKVSLVLAHQYLTQFRPESIDALGSTAFTIIFHVLKKDAERLLHTIGGRLASDVLAELSPREAVARIGAEWMRLDTPECSAEVDATLRDRAIALSRERYYVPKDAAAPPILRPAVNTSPPPAVAPAPAAPKPKEEFVYERFTSTP